MAGLEARAALLRWFSPLVVLAVIVLLRLGACIFLGTLPARGVEPVIKRKLCFRALLPVWLRFGGGDGPCFSPSFETVAFCRENTLWFGAVIVPYRVRGNSVVVFSGFVSSAGGP